MNNTTRFVAAPSLLSFTRVYPVKITVEKIVLRPEVVREEVDIEQEVARKHLQLFRELFNNMLDHKEGRCPAPLVLWEHFGRAAHLIVCWRNALLLKRHPSDHTESLSHCFRCQCHVGDMLPCLAFMSRDELVQDGHSLPHEIVRRIGASRGYFSEDLNDFCDRSTFSYEKALCHVMATFDIADLMEPESGKTFTQECADAWKKLPLSSRNKKAQYLEGIVRKPAAKQAESEEQPSSPADCAAGSPSASNSSLRRRLHAVADYASDVPSEDSVTLS